MAIYKGRNLVSVNNFKEKNIYVEVPEGSTIEDMSENNTIAITPTEYAELQDGVNYRTGTFNSKSIPQVINALNENYYINQERSLACYQQANITWTRPQDWPDLDSLNLQMSGDDFIYMTYDADVGGCAIAWHIETVGKVAATLEVGHISNGVYVADETYTVNHNTNFVRWTEDLSGYLVIRITGPITRCYSYSVTRDGQTQMYRQQPILERIAWVPHLIEFCTNVNSNCWGTYLLEREKIANGDGSALTSLYYAWTGCYRLQSLDISNFYTPNATNLRAVFNGCQSLRELNLSHFNTSKVTSMESLFNGCRALKKIILTNWDTSKVTNFSLTFYNCRTLTEIQGLENFNTSAATTMQQMFNICHNIQELKVENFNVSNVTNMSNMFSECYSLKKLDLSNWRPSKVTNLNATFNACYSLKQLNLTGWTTGTLTNVSSLFSNCRSLTSLDVSWLHITSACTTIYCLFYNCSSIKRLDIPNDWDLSGIGNTSNTCNSVFSGCTSLEIITGIKDWKFYFTNSLSSMFLNCWSLQTVDISGWKIDTVTNLASLFDYCYCLKELNLTNWSPTNCTSLTTMFRSCYSLKTIGNVSNWNTGKVVNFSSMFQDCQSLQTFPNISNWDFSKATNISNMFAGLITVEEITLNNLNLPLCTTIATMFNYCYNLKKITLKNWSMPSLNTSPGAFIGNCSSLKEVDINLAIPYNHSYTGDSSLTHESLLNILNSLPTVSTTRTLNLVNANINHLTAAEKAIATGKGWTLAN